MQLGLIYPVEFKDGWDKVLHYVGKEDGRVGKVEVPADDRGVLAQEDFWVQPDLLQIIHDTLATVGKFKQVPVAAKDQPPAAGGVRYRYRNTNWELDLVLKQQGGKTVLTGESTIKNINPGKPRCCSAAAPARRADPAPSRASRYRASHRHRGLPAGLGQIDQDHPAGKHGPHPHRRLRSQDRPRGGAALRLVYLADQAHGRGEAQLRGPAGLRPQAHGQADRSRGGR